MSSISTVIAFGGMAAYATSKVAVEQLAHVLHLELAHTGIGVGTVYASWIDTPLIANAELAMPSFARLRRVCARRAARPERLARHHHPEACAVSVVDAIERRSGGSGCRTRSG